MNLFSNMHFIAMFITAVCVFFIKLRWTKKKSIEEHKFAVRRRIVLEIFHINFFNFFGALRLNFTDKYSMEK